MPRNIRNTRRNFARPSDTFTAATSFASVSFSSGNAASSIDITKKSNPIGPSGNNTYTITGANGVITGTTTNTTATTVTCAFSVTSDLSGTQTVNIAESNYNGIGKSVAVTGFNPGTLFTSSVLVIGGGGQGGSIAGNVDNSSGGGGAGAYREFNNYILGTGTNFTVTIGAGGGGNTGATHGADGSSSQFSNIIAGGGGGGGGGLQQNAPTPPAGGSGGGAGSVGANTTLYLGGQYSAPNSPGIVANKELYSVTGFNGGQRNGNYQTGGGGGASAVGQSNVNNNPSGGAGRASSITGSSVTRAGGGGGGADGFGGSGGGGNARYNADGNAGSANTGGGGGGSYVGTLVNRMGGSGGSGVVIIRYPNTRTITIGAGLTGSTATDGSFRVTTITAGTGNVSFA